MTLRSLLRRLGRGVRADRGPASTGPPVRLVLITRADCPLCEEMKAEIARISTSRPFTLSEVDVLSDPELIQRHALSIPVLEIDGRVAFEGRLRAEDLERALEPAQERASDAEEIA